MSLKMQELNCIYSIRGMKNINKMNWHNSWADNLKNI